MLLLVHGKDTYRSLREFKKLRKDSREEKNDLDVLFFDFSRKDEGLESFKKELSQNLIFNKKKIFFVKEILSLIKNDPETAKFLKNSIKLNDFDFVFWEEEVDKKNPVFKIISDKGEIKNYDLLKGVQLEKWILKEIENKKGKITGQALQKLILSTGNDLWTISNEIDKLVSYKQKQEITEQDINSLTSLKVEGDIFRAIDFLASKKKKEALKIFYRHIKKGDHVLYLITMVAFQFRNLILVKKSDKATAKELGMHPFVFQKSLRQSGFFSEEELKTIYDKILKTDKDIKTGKATPEVAFDLLITGI